MFEKFGIIPKLRSVWDSDDLAVEIMRGTDTWSMMPDIVCERYRDSIVPIALPSDWNAPYSIDLICRSHRAKNPFLTLLMHELSSGGARGNRTPVLCNAISPLYMLSSFVVPES